MTFLRASQFFLFIFYISSGILYCQYLRFNVCVHSYRNVQFWECRLFVCISDVIQRPCSYPNFIVDVTSQSRRTSVLLQFCWTSEICISILIYWKVMFVLKENCFSLGCFFILSHGYYNWFIYKMVAEHLFISSLFPACKEKRNWGCSYLQNPKKI